MPSLTDPLLVNPLTAAAGWIEGVVLGSVAVAVATIAVAAVGFLMLSGRVPLRRGATVVVGAFIVFGSPLIASGIMGIGTAVAPASIAPPPITAVPPPTMPPPPPQPSAYDPYAGASVPVR